MKCKIKKKIKFNCFKCELQLLHFHYQLITITDYFKNLHVASGFCMQKQQLQ